MLDAIADKLPKTADELRSVHGLGQGKISEFGAAILEICQRRAQVECQQVPRAPATPQVTQSSPWIAAPGRNMQGIGGAGVGSSVAPAPKRPRSGPLPGDYHGTSVTSVTAAPPVVVPAPPPVIDPAMLTSEQRQAAERALRGENLFFTGAAGTGKSFLLRYIIQELERTCPNQVAITAPTGIAAVNVGGQTLHSFSGIGLWTNDGQVRNPVRFLIGRIKKNKKAFSRWCDTKVLIIDEVSMLEPELFEQLEQVASELRQDRSRGFGGMQMLLCGDFLQLPPVETDRDGTARWSFCFETPAWKRCQFQRGTIILREPVRQSGDPLFVQLLNEVRSGGCPPRVAEMCQRCLVGRKQPPQDGIVATRLYCTNRDVDKENEGRLMALPGELYVIKAQDSFCSRVGSGQEGKGCATPEKKRLEDILNKIVPMDLRLKVDAQVILLRKIQGTGLVNGSRGVVRQVHENAATIRFDNGRVVKVERERFQHQSSIVVSTRCQLPLKLGWALTVHKSQGMTLTRAEVHLDGAFSCGQAYVALSRLVSFDGLWIGGRGISQHNIRAHPKALAFYGAVPS